MTLFSSEVEVPAPRPFGGVSSSPGFPFPATRLHLIETYLNMQHKFNRSYRPKLYHRLETHYCPFNWAAMTPGQQGRFHQLESVLKAAREQGRVVMIKKGPNGELEMFDVTERVEGVARRKMAQGDVATMNRGVAEEQEGVTQMNGGMSEEQEGVATRNGAMSEEQEGVATRNDMEEGGAMYKDVYTSEEQEGVAMSSDVSEEQEDVLAMMRDIEESVAMWSDVSEEQEGVATRRDIEEGVATMNMNEEEYVDVVNVSANDEEKIPDRVYDVEQESEADDEIPDRADGVEVGVVQDDSFINEEIEHGE